MERRHLAAGAALALVAVVGCTKDDRQTPEHAGGAAPPRTSDAFEEYRRQVNKAGGDEPGRPIPADDTARQEFHAGKAALCRMSKADLQTLKDMSGFADFPAEGREPLEAVKQQAQRQANLIGAMWEYGCGNGHDDELYRPRAVTNDPIEPMPDLSIPEPPSDWPAPAEGQPWPDWPGAVYTLGDCDPALRAWQLRMNVYGYDFEGTGCYGEKTEAAVLDLQAANGLPTSGKLGPETWNSAWVGVAPR